MARATPGRRAALDILRAVRSGALADRALDSAVRGLDPRDRAFTHELVYGTLRLRGRLDHYLAHHSSRPLDSIDPDVLDVLRLGAYQLLEMNGVPDYAAVSESVELARAAAPRTTGFVNAVLQSLRRAPAASTFPSLARDPVDHLATWGSLPRWLAERWASRFGAEEAGRLASSSSERPDLYLRVLGTARDAAIAALEAVGVGVEPVEFFERAVRVTSGSVADALGAAPVIVQDPAAGAVVSFAGAVPSRVIDLAAAPGGKAIALAGDEPDSGRIIAAADISSRRLGRLRENVERLGGVAASVVAVGADGRVPPFRPAPLVLLDAPCTGTGTFRRHPDGRWRVQPADLAALAGLQRELLDAAATIVAPGGLLVYATCSLEPEENEEQVDAFLERNPMFELERGNAVSQALTDDRGMLRVLPHVQGVDGAFAARLRRRA